MSMLMMMVGHPVDDPLVLSLSATTELSCQADYTLTWTDMGVEHILFEKAGTGGSYSQIHATTGTTHNRVTEGGRYFYKVEAAGQQAELELIYSPDPILAAVVNCNDVNLAWGPLPDVTWKVYRDNVLLADVGSATSYTDSPPSTGSYTYKIVATVSGTSCTGEDVEPITFTAPQPAGTLISSDCVGNETIGTYADGDCGTYNKVDQVWDCTGCHDAYQTGYLEPATCYNGNVARKRRDNPCDPAWYWDIIENCECGCSGGNCVEKVAVSDGFNYPQPNGGADPTITFQQNGSTTLPSWLSAMVFDGFQHSATCGTPGYRGRYIRISINTWPADCASGSFTINVNQSHGDTGCDSSWSTVSGNWSTVSGFSGTWSITCQGYPALTLTSFTVAVDCINERLECTQ